MSPESFVYWLQGFAELHPEPPSAEQWQSIRERLAGVLQVLLPEAPTVVMSPMRSEIVATELPITITCEAD